MSKTYKHQATYDYLHGNKEVKGKILYGIKRYFNKCNFPKWDYSRMLWYKHKIRLSKEAIKMINKEVKGEQTQTFGNGGNMTRQQLLSLPVREWDNIKNYDAIIVVPTGKKHDSGYALMALVGCNEHLEPYEIAAYCDDIQLLTKTVGQELRCDMFYKNNCLRFHSNMYYFQVGRCHSTTEIKIINRTN